MGKSQVKKKTRGIRHNPIRVPDSHLGGGKGNGKADPAKEREMLPVLNKLSSAEYADRTWACAAICNLVQNDPATRRLFQARNVVGALIERLSDSVDEVVVEASGALRNLAIDGGHELCAEMFNKGIMSHLTVLIAKITETIDSIVIPTNHPNPNPNPNANAPLSDSQLQSRKHLLSLAENVISLIWCLAEANHKTLAAVNAAGVEGLLLRALAGRDLLGQGVALAAAHAMYSLSQDNFTFQRSVISQPSALAELVNICGKDHTASISSAKNKGKGKGKGKAANGTEEDDGRALLMRVLVAGTLRNLVDPGSKADESVDIVGLTNSTILPLVNSLLDFDLPSVVSRVLELVTQIPQQDVTVNLAKGVKTDHRSTAEIALDGIERNLMTVVVGLEILTGICAGLEDVGEEYVPVEGIEEIEIEADGDEEMEDGDDNDDDIDNDDAEMDNDLDVTPDTHTHVSAPLSTPTIITPVTLSHLITTLSLPRCLTNLSLLNPSSFPASPTQPSPHPPTTSILSILHLRALEALNNLLLTIVASLPSNPTATAQVSSVIPMQDIWGKLFGIVDMLKMDPASLKHKGQELRGEILEMALGCIWGLAKIAPEQLNVQTQQEQTLIDAKALVVRDICQTRIIETLAALAMRRNVTVEENKVIGTWLLGILTQSPSSEILITVVNALIDAYSDETRAYDQPVFVSGGFLSVLGGVLGKVKAEVKKIDRRKQLRLRAMAEETVDNLAAFVQYRKALGR